MKMKTSLESYNLSINEEGELIYQKKPMYLPGNHLLRVFAIGALLMGSIYWAKYICNPRSEPLTQMNSIRHDPQIKVDSIESKLEYYPRNK